MNTPGELVKFIAGQNIDIKQEGSNFTISANVKEGPFEYARTTDGKPLIKIGNKFY